jgi:hypothetical protein
MPNGLLAADQHACPGRQQARVDRHIALEFNVYGLRRRAEATRANGRRTQREVLLPRVVRPTERYPQAVETGGEILGQVELDQQTLTNRCCVAVLTCAGDTLAAPLPGDLTMAASASKQATTDTHRPLAAAVDPSAASGEPTAPVQRHAMIAEAAFFMAQARGFTPCQELNDWLAAEREIEQRQSNPDH